jgi:hypothetical protein
VSLPADFSPADRVLLGDHLARAYAALARCQRLCGSLGAVVEATLAAHGLAGGYDRVGLESTVTARVGAMDARG